MDIWVARDPENASKVASVLRDFGFAAATQEMLSAPDQIFRMGVPPLRLELLTSISGVEFEECYIRRELAVVDGILVPVIRLDDLKRNKLASGRLKDLADLEELQ
jgi:hypothetical protein